MFNRIAIPQAILVTLSIAAFPAAALAERHDSIRYADELEACVTAVTEKIDLRGVHRIRHVITKSDARDLGYALTFETSTYAGPDERQYSAYCVATGNNRPTRLRIEEITI